MRGWHADRGVYLALLAFTAVGARAQFNPSVPRPGQPVPYEGYGRPEPADLSDIAYGGQRYHRTIVRTKGTLRPLVGSPYLVLTEGPARVLLIPVPEMDRDSRTLLGRRIEVTGLARVLPTQQEMKQCYAQFLPESKCEDYELPALPDARPDWPEASITFFGVSDAEPSARKSAEAGSPSFAELTGRDGKTVSVVGQFGGRNLNRDLPAGSEASSSDWVLKRGADAIWVTGKQPRGNGWKLDASYSGDTIYWLEVTGRVESRGDIIYLHASKVALTTAPKVAKDGP